MVFEDTSRFAQGCNLGIEVVLRLLWIGHAAILEIEAKVSFVILG